MNTNIKLEDSAEHACSNPLVKYENGTKPPSEVVDYKAYIPDYNLQNLPESYKSTYEAYINEVKGLANVSIVDSVSEEHIRNFQHFNFRYYEDKYCINYNSTDGAYCDTLIRIHSNKLFLISLASGNDIIQRGKDIVEINFVINNCDRANINLRGKKKRGSKGIEPDTILCQVKCRDDDKLYNIRAGISGRIIEINEKIKENPNLLRTEPKGLGFLAVISPVGKPTEYEHSINNLKFKLFTEEEYIQHLTNRVPQLLS